MPAQTENLWQHLTQLAYPRHALKHPAEHEKASRYVHDTLLAHQYRVEADPIPFEGKTYQNWVATLPEDRMDLPAVIIGAHLDSVPDSPGADDNASGVAVLLEAARLYREKRLVEKRPQTAAVHFVGFDLEECGLVGSIAYVQRLRRENRKVAGMLSLEMLGFFSTSPRSQRYPPGIASLYSDQGDFVGLVGTFGSLRFLWKVRKAFKKTPQLKTQSLAVPGKGHWLEDIRRSDHASFWDAGFPAVLVTDTSFYRNPNYHTPEDTVEKLDLSFMARITDAVANFSVA